MKSDKRGTLQISPSATPLRQIAAVNGKFAGAFIAGGMALWLWPHSPDWWTFYPMSLLSGAMALALVVQGVGLIRQIRKFERDQDEFGEQGNPIKTASLAQEDFMTEKGVIRDVR